MSEFKIRFEMDNAAFEVSEVSEVVRILRQLAADIESRGDLNMSVRDINGNYIGESWEVR